MVLSEEEGKNNNFNKKYISLIFKNYLMMLDYKIIDKLRSDVLADIRDTKILLGIEPAPPIPIEDPESDNSQRRKYKNY